MTPAQQIAAWRERGIDVAANRKGKKMKTKPTPGPWKCTDETGPNYDQYIVTEGRVFIACAKDGTMYDKPPSGEERNANARLIAAAPDLLAACQSWDDGFVDGEQFDAERFCVWFNERRAMVRTAIAKATT